MIRRLVLAGVVLLCVVAPVSARPAPPDDDTCRLHAALWSGGWHQWHAAGAACWLATGDGGWRLDVMGEEVAPAGQREPPVRVTGGVDRVLERSGDGWSLLAGSGGLVYGAAWGKPLRPLDPDIAGRLAALVAAFTDSAPPDGGDVRRPRRVAWRPGDGERTTLRRRLVARQRGQGGPGGTLRIRPETGPDAGEAVIVTDSRWPGRLVLRLLPARRLPCDRDLLEVTDLPLRTLLVAPSAP